MQQRCANWLALTLCLAVACCGPLAADEADAPAATPQSDTPKIESRSQGVTGVLLDNVRGYLGMEDALKTPSVYIDVQIKGVDGPLLANVRAYLGLEKQKSSPQLSPTRIKHLYRQAPDEIKKALQAFGYYRAQVEGELRAPEPEKTAQPWLAHFTIMPGEALRLTALHFEIRGEGREDSAFLPLRSTFPLQIGAPLVHAVYEKGKTDLQKLAEERGYFEARFLKSEVQVDLESDSAQAELVFDTGPRYRFGTIRFTQGDFSEKFLRTFLTFQTDDFYTTKAFLEFRNALSESDYFENIELQSQRLKEAGRRMVNVTVNLQPRRQNLYRLRFGYGTDTDLRAGIEWQRNINRHGHRMEAKLGVTQNKNKYVGRFNYIVPVGKAKEDYLDFGVRYSAEDFSYDDIEQNAIGGSTRLEDLSLRLDKHQLRILGRWRLEEILSAEYLLERYDLMKLMFSPDELAVIDSFLTANEKKVLAPDFHALIPGIAWIYTEADNRTYSRRGVQLRVGLRGTHEWLGSNFAFWQAQGSALGILGIGNTQGRVIARGEAAYTEAETVASLDANMLPHALQYRTGGDRTVRGYAFESLEGGLTGGKHLLVGSIEYEYRLREKWSAAVFFDTGNSFNSFVNYRLKQGAGVGLRWHSPVGLVRVDVATALSEDGDPWRVHINIGPDF